MSQFTRAGVLLGEPFKLTLDSTSLRRSLDYLGDWCDDTASRISHLQVKMKQDATEVQQLGSRVDAFEPQIGTCNERLDSLEKLQVRVP